MRAGPLARPEAAAMPVSTPPRAAAAGAAGAAGSGAPVPWMITSGGLSASCACRAAARSATSSAAAVPSHSWRR